MSEQPAEYTVQHPVEAMVPIRLLAPQTWEAHWDGALLRYQEQFQELDPQVREESQAIIAGLYQTKIDPKGDGFITELADPGEAHKYMLVEMALQLESRGWLKPGSLTDLHHWILAHRAELP